VDPFLRDIAMRVLRVLKSPSLDGTGFAVYAEHATPPVGEKA
jgi:hypothetical protein